MEKSANGAGVRYGGELSDGEIRLKKDGGVYDYTDGLDREFNHRRDYFPLESEYIVAVQRAYGDRSHKDAESSASWKRRYPFLSVSPEVEKYIEEKDKFERNKRIEKLEADLNRARKALEEARSSD